MLKDPVHIYRGTVYRILNLFAKQMSDKTYIECKWFLTFGRRINLDAPRSFNEKLQWLKLYNRNPQYTRLVDKYEVKKHVVTLIGEEYVTPTLAVYERAEDIDFEALCCHVSGQGRHKVYFRMGKNSCHIDPLYMLGCTSRALLPLWRAQILSAQKEVWNIPAICIGPEIAYFQRV